MIEKLPNSPMCDSAIVYKTSLQSIEKIFEKDPQMAGELAICLLEVLLRGEHTSDDIIIQALLKSAEYQSEKDRERYSVKIEAERDKKVQELRLEEIAALAKRGLPQAEISKQLGIPKSTVSYRLKTIRKDYGWLLDDQVQEEEVGRFGQVGLSNKVGRNFEEKDLEIESANLGANEKISEVFRF